MANNENNLIIEPEKNTSSSVSITPDKVEVKKGGNLVIGTLNLALNPLKKRNELYYKNNPWYLIVDIILLALLAALAIFAFFNYNQKPAKRIEAKISSDSEIVSAGSMVSFNLNYESFVEADDTMLYVNLPENFILDSTQPANLFNSEKNAFDIGRIEPGVNGKIKVSGLVWGNTDDQQKISFNFKCSTCGKNGVNSSLLFHINNPAVAVEINMNKKVYQNSEFDGKIKLQNNSNNNIKNIILDLGSDISLKGSDKEIKDNKILIDSLDSNQIIEISFAATSSKNDFITIKPQLNLDILENNFSFSDNELSIEVSQPDLILEMTSDTKNVNEGEVIKYNLNYKNNGELAENITSTFSSNNPNFSLKSLKAINLPSNISLKNNILKINQLANGESIQIQLEATYDRRKFATGQELSAQTIVDYTSMGQSLSHAFVSSKNKVNSSISASASAYYYTSQGDQLGVGPLPPAVDMTTRYWVSLDLSASGNNLNNLSLSAELPDNVYFTGNKRILDGDLVYGEIGKRLIWEIPTITSGNKYRADFEIALTPGASDLGKILNLVENIKLSAKDSFTGSDITKTLPNINTNLKNDRLSSGKGRVVNIN